VFFEGKICYIMHLQDRVNTCGYHVLLTNFLILIYIIYSSQIIFFNLFRLLQHLQNIKPDVESHGFVSKVPLYMVTSFLYAIDMDCMKNTKEISGGDLTNDKMYLYYF